MDGSLVALIFAMLAMGTQFVTLPSSDDKEQTAEFYGEILNLACKVVEVDPDPVEKFRHHIRR